LPGVTNESPPAPPPKALTYTSGRMLHLSDCEHFYEDKPPRLATKEELRTLKPCFHCARRAE
jgi:hypothetical protein